MFVCWAQCEYSSGLGGPCLPVVWALIEKRLGSKNSEWRLVEIEFVINNREYLVRRGIKPNVFDIVVNGSPLHREADDRAMQRILE